MIGRYFDTITSLVGGMRFPHCEELPFSERQCKSTRSMMVWVDVDNVNHISTKKATLSDCFLFKALGYVM